MLSRIRALIIKELLAILRDKKSRFVLIVPPLVQLFVFSFAATQEAKNQSLAILNLDRGQSAFLLEQKFTAARTFTKIIHLGNPSEISPIIQTQQAIAVLSIPQDFSSNITKEKEAVASLILDGRKTNTAQIVQGYALRIINEFQQELPNNKNKSVQIVTRNWFNPNLDFRWYTVPSLVCILTTLISLLVTGLSVAREREMGTFDQLLVSPLHPLEILIGKALPALIIAMLEGTFMVLAAIFLMRVPFNGSLLLLYGSMMVFLLAIIGIGLFISSLSMTQQQAILGAFVFLVPAVILSGYASPIENMPPWLQIITRGNPLRYFMTIVRGIFLKDINAFMVWRQTWPMAIIALITLSTATWLFKKRME